MKQVTRATHVLDATGKTPGRLASVIAPMLIGKLKPDYLPNLDSGDIVEVVNASKMVLTGNKLENTYYHRHTAHPGGLKEKQLKTAFEEDASKVLEHAVSRMLPKNLLRDRRLARLTIKN